MRSSRRGIDAYLFMYVTGEPTEALIQQRPDVLGTYSSFTVRLEMKCLIVHSAGRKPEFHTLARELIQAIVRTYPATRRFPSAFLGTRDAGMRLSRLW